MSDEISKKRSLSEISHLFLSSIRDRQTEGSPRPQRTPPQKPDVSIDLTPEEFAQVYGGDTPAQPARRAVPVTAVLAAHLNGKQFDRVKEYARHLAVQGGRVGLIEVDGSEFRLMCFENSAPGAAPEPETPGIECFDARQMAEALEELNCDVDRWLVLVPSPRTPEARAVLREADHWVLLSTSDHDGVVAGYRLLKGLVDATRPRLSLALVDCDEEEAGRIHRKLSSVCRQFLDWELDPEPVVQKTFKAVERLALLCRPTRDKGQLATAPQWAVVEQFLASVKQEPVQPEPAMQQVMEPERVEERKEAAAEAAAPVAVVAGPLIQPPAPPTIAPVAAPAPAPIIASMHDRDDSFAEVIDLPNDDVSGASILGAILRGSEGGLVECPVRAPMCGEARLAVGRDRAVVLLAVARQGLSDLRSIGQAYRWLIENRDLIGMAVPQFAIDPKQSPRLRLLVDRSDLSADLLRPILQSDHVTVQSYRKLRWGQKLGVFLEAA